MRLNVHGMTVDVAADNEPDRLLAHLRPALEKLAAAGAARTSLFDSDGRQWVAMVHCEQALAVIDTADEALGQTPLWSQLDSLAAALVAHSEQLTP